jgi:hypothetical protein
MIGYDMNVTPKNQMPKVVKSDENSDQLYIVCLFGITIDADRGGSKNCERLRVFWQKRMFTMQWQVLGNTTCLGQTYARHRLEAEPGYSS